MGMRKMAFAVVLGLLVVSDAARSEDKRIHAIDCIDLEVESEPGNAWKCPQDENVFLRIYNECPYGDILVTPLRGGRIRGGSERLSPVLVRADGEYDGSESFNKVFCVPSHVDVKVGWCADWEDLDRDYIKRKEEASGVNYIFVSNCHD